MCYHWDVSKNCEYHFLLWNWLCSYGTDVPLEWRFYTWHRTVFWQPPLVNPASRAGSKASRCFPHRSRCKEQKWWVLTLISCYLIFGNLSDLDEHFFFLFCTIVSLACLFLFGFTSTTAIFPFKFTLCIFSRAFLGVRYPHFTCFLVSFYCQLDTT